MKKISIIILLTITGLSCSDTINEMLDELNATVPVCVAFDSTATAPDGRGWANAYPTIAEGVDAAQPGQEIWVKAGTYNLSAILTIAKSVSIYGGFNGTEKRRNERSNNNQITIISQTLAGNILFDDTSAGKTILIDCFTIKGNHIEIILGASPAFNNCRFDKVTYNGNGGALNMDDSSVTISQCLFDTCEASTGSGGAIYAINNATVNISGSTFTGNTATAHGGAIYANATSLNIVNTTFNSNVASSASSNGGAIYAQNSNISVSNCSFTANSSNYSAGSNGGGAMYITSTSLNITNTTFTNNDAEINGGAIYAAGNSTVAISNNSGFTSNSAVSGGAICANTGSEITISSSYFGLAGSIPPSPGNSATNYGGAIYTADATTKLNIANCDFYNNQGTGGTSWGGAITVDFSSIVQIDNSEFNTNLATNGGGAIYVSSGSLNVSSSEFINNSSTAYRGGAISCSGGIITVNACVFNTNHAGTNITNNCDGGAISLTTSSTSTLINSIFHNNSALNAPTTGTAHGGAIYIGVASHNLVNLTFYSNHAQQYGGAIYSATANTIYNSIFYSNSASGGSGYNVYSSVASILDHCFYIGGLTGASGINCITSGDPFVSINSSEATFLYPSSIVRNLGSNAALPAGYTTDLAGNPRVVGGEVDMGAYEWQ
ncbi:MAG: hypothetical protein JXN64_07120 [Spirochaetes bacterium]|nr:hypothetical protein [Spirochaetota bacterium]